MPHLALAAVLCGYSRFCLLQAREEKFKAEAAAKAAAEEAAKVSPNSHRASLNSPPPAARQDDP
jgi:hypothetical protein